MTIVVRASIVGAQEEAPAWAAALGGALALVFWGWVIWAGVRYRRNHPDLLASVRRDGGRALTRCRTAIGAVLPARLAPGRAALRSGAGAVPGSQEPPAAPPRPDSFEAHALGGRERDLIDDLRDARSSNGTYVFVSYRREDADYVRGLTEYLVRKGITCWFDTEIAPGARWMSEIANRIERAAAVIVVMSGREPTDFVEGEVSWALRHEKPLFPISLDGGMFFALSTLQVVEVRPGRYPDDVFVAALKERLAAG